MIIRPYNLLSFSIQSYNLSNQTEINGISFNMGYVCFLLVLTAAILMIPFSEAAFSGAADGLRTFAVSVLPSLFPLVVCSNYLLRSPVIRKAVGRGGIVPSILLPLFTALCGIPSSAVLINGLHAQGSFSRRGASFLCALYTQPGPMFIISALSAGFLRNRSTGKFFLLACYLPPLVISVLFFVFRRKKPDRTAPKLNEPFAARGSGITKAIAEASLTMVRICGTIVFFSVLFGVSDALGIFSFLPVQWSGLIKGAIEMTNGIYALSFIPTRLSFSLIAFLLSFGGLSVFVQSKMIFPGLSSKTYFITKLLLGVISGSIVYFVYPIIPMPIETMSGLSEGLPALKDQFIRRSFYIVSAVMPLMLTAVLSLAATRFLRKEKGR